MQQTLPDFELVVADNASEDMTESVVKSFGDNRIRYVKGDRNIGIRGNWQRCLSLARGEYITILPDDDMMMPENLERKIEVLAANPGVGMVHSKFHVIDAEGSIIKYDSNYMHGLDRISDAIESRIQLITANANTINAATVVFRKECYTRLGGFSNDLKFAIDWEYWMRIAVFYDVAFMAKPLAKWRMHSDTCSSKNLGSSKFLKFREDIRAKKPIANIHVRSLQNGGKLRKLIWQQMGERLANNMDIVLDNGGKRSEVFLFCLEMCLCYPWLLSSHRVLKTFLKSALNRKAVLLMKNM